MNIKKFLYKLKSIFSKENINLDKTYLEDIYFGLGFVNLTLDRSGLFVVLPENFNIDIHISNFPPDSNGFRTVLKGFDKDKVYHLLGLLSSIPARNKLSLFLS